MTLQERDEKKKELRAKIKRWPARLKKLATRKDSPLSERAFCIKYKIPVFGFNRAKNLQIEPREKKIEQVESALKAEGV